MNRTFLLILTFLVPCILFFVNAKHVGGFITEKDKRISVNTPAKIVHSKLACTSLCLQNSGCCFANFNVLTKECILGSSRCHDKTESATGWLFLRRGTSYNNKVFFYFGNKLDWYDAQNFCESFGMRLATISTTEENQFVKSLTQRSNGVWLGGSDKPNEGDWHWNKPNLPLAFTNWGWSALIKQPDNVFNQDCLSYWRCDPFETNYQWADAGCGSSYYFICERIIRVDTETWPIE